MTDKNIEPTFDTLVRQERNKLERDRAYLASQIDTLEELFQEFFGITIEEYRDQELNK